MTLLLAALALVAFAANSILCRLALADGRIDAASFTTLRLLAGVLVLVPLALSRRTAAPGSGPGAPAPRSGPDANARRSRLGGSLAAGLALALYALPFSFAYLSLTAGTGALLLFGAVQATMILAGLRAGERPGAIEWTGFVIALAGLVLLVAPGVTAPSPLGALLMVVAGAAWGIYSLLGRSAADPIAATAGNFLRAAPWAIAASLVTLGAAHTDRRGALLAVVSGAVTSGLGYVAWYAALPGFGAMRAATAQLAVPAIAAIGGVILLGEPPTARLAGAAALVLGGVALALRGRASGPPST